MPRFSDFPILTREVRSRFRRERAFALLGFLLALVGWALWRRVSEPNIVPSRGVPSFAPLSQELVVQLVWTQIAGVCLLAPMLAAPLIVRERESGAVDDLLLTPLSPLRLALEKWAAGGLFLGLVLLALGPLDLVAVLLGNTPLSEMWPLALLLAGCLGWGSALGTMCSAGARRAGGALRSAMGVSLVWVIGSLLCAVYTGETGWGGGGLGSLPVWVRWIGRTNPILCALELLQPSPFLVPKWPYCAAFLAGGTVFFLGVAAHSLRKPLPELPIIAPKQDGKIGGVSGALARMEMPLVGRFAPSNPILGREARGKFRVRQPPLAVLISELVLGAGVLAGYLFLAYQALADATTRPAIFWGVAWTGFFVSILAASSLGGAALARERENGTWDALRLSLLSAPQILRGKLVASLGTCLALSFPAWPLLLICVDWRGAWTVQAGASQVQPFQFVAALAIWLGVLWSQTLLGLWVSGRSKKTGGAVGSATIIALGWMIGSLFLFVMGRSHENSALGFLAVSNPLVALALATDPQTDRLWTASGWPCALFSFVVGALLLALTEAEVGAQMGGEAERTASV